MRTHLVAFATSLAILVGCDNPDTCTHLACTSGASFVGHVRVPLSTMIGATVTVCVNDACGTGLPAVGFDGGLPDATSAADAGAPAVDATTTVDAGPTDDGGGVSDAPPGDDGASGDAFSGDDGASGDAGPVDSPDAATPDAGSPLSTSDPSTPALGFVIAGALGAQGEIITEPDGWLLVVATPVGIEAKNGDRYRMTIAAADGSTLLDVTRGVNYADVYPNGQNCDKTACLQGVANAWPTTPNNLTCSANDIFAAAYFTLFPGIVQTGSVLRVCRNGVCDEDPAFSGLGSSQDVLDGQMKGPLFVSYELSQSGTQLVLEVDVDPAQAADGDKFTITMTDPSGKQLENINLTATYDVAVANEPGCDPYPIRTLQYVQQ